MALRSAHGRAGELGALVVVETPPADELGVPESAPAAVGRAERRQDGTLTVAGAQAVGRLGGIAKARRQRFAANLADKLGLNSVPAELEPYVEHAAAFAKVQLGRLAELFGEVGPGPSSMIHSGALALAASRAAYAAGDGVKGARLGDQSRQSLLTAHHLAELEAKARKADAPPVDLGRALKESP